MVDKRLLAALNDRGRPFFLLKHLGRQRFADFLASSRYPDVPLKTSIMVKRP